jgi:hypothetical protein
MENVQFVSIIGLPIFLFLCSNSRQSTWFSPILSTLIYIFWTTCKIFTLALISQDMYEQYFKEISTSTENAPLPPYSQ